MSLFIRLNYSTSRDTVSVDLKEQNDIEYGHTPVPTPEMILPPTKTLNGCGCLCQYRCGLSGTTEPSSFHMGKHRVRLTWLGSRKMLKY